MFFGKATGLLKSGFTGLVEQVRNRVTCSKRNGKEKSVKTAMKRFFRIDDKLWIRPSPGESILTLELRLKLIIKK